jgi:hypothetical protein
MAEYCSVAVPDPGPLIQCFLTPRSRILKNPGSGINIMIIFTRA